MKAKRIEDLKFRVHQWISRYDSSSSPESASVVVDSILSLGSECTFDLNAKDFVLASGNNSPLHVRAFARVRADLDGEFLFKGQLAADLAALALEVDAAAEKRKHFRMHLFD